MYCFNLNFQPYIVIDSDAGVSKTISNLLDCILSSGLVLTIIIGEWFIAFELISKVVENPNHSIYGDPLGDYWNRAKFLIPCVVK